jgi:hypothetical protein
MFRSLPSVVAAMTAVLALSSVAPARAQELMAASSVANTVLFPVAPVAPEAVASSAAAVDTTKADADRGPTFVRASFTPRPPQRPMMLPALYASQVALQALDVHSTYSALDRGAYEANPLMNDVVKSKGAMTAVKVGVAASTIWIAERMWKRGNRAGAIATMLLANGVTAAVVANNYRVASSLR